MYSLIESFRSALLSVRAYALRSSLTTLGIVIGVGSVVAVVSIIQGLSSTIGKNFENLGSNSLSVVSDTPFADVLQGKRNRLTVGDYRLLQRYFNRVAEITPSFSPFGDFGSTVEKESRSTFARVYAVTSNYQDANRFYPSIGRFFVRTDITSRRRVCVIGEKVRQNLKLPPNPVGAFLTIAGNWFKIVGVMEPRGDMFGLSQDEYVLVPFSVGEVIAPDEMKEDIRISINVRDQDQLDAVSERATRILRSAHKLKAEQPNDFKVQTATQLMGAFTGVIATTTAVLAGVVGISLLVGGIGIMNIMLVSVTERTKEIGICKALGAQRHHIIAQFLFEAVILSLLGGVLGLALGCALGIFISNLIPNFPAAVVPWWAAVLAIGFSTMIGIVFGIVPAAKAANLDPVEALHHE